MDIMDLGCPLLRLPFVETFMALTGYLGHGLIASLISLIFLAHGYRFNNRRSKQAGIALIAALIVAGTAAQILKYTIQLPRPIRDSYGFPSGHTSAAFALAAVLGSVFPGQSAIFYFLATLTGISRLYFRAHFTTDVIGGVVIGLAAGLPIARKLIPPADRLRKGRWVPLVWCGAVAVGMCGLIFFGAVENNIITHIRRDRASVPSETRVAALDFGTPEARPLLQSGWSADEHWLDPNKTVVWASGLVSTLTLALPAVQDYRVRLLVQPYAPEGSACQRLEVKVNNQPVSKILLEKGWQAYEFPLPKYTIRAGNNDVEFFFNYSDSPKSRRRSQDERPLSVAFDSLEVIGAR